MTLVEFKLSGKLILCSLLQKNWAGGGLFSLVYIFPVFNIMLISASEKEEQV